MKTTKIALCCLGILLFGACKKDKETTPPASPAQPTPYYVRMTDAPGPYAAVNIDLQAVEITGNGNSVSLNVNPGIYNLLNFANGVDTLIATGSLTVGKVEQIRLILGANNSVVTTAGSTFPLSTPSAQQSGLKLQVHHTLQAGIAYQVLLDFDAAQSIVVEGNGSYSLKPVIRTIETAIGGSIRGTVSQPGVPTTITATSGSSSNSTIADINGNFLLAGLPPGTYTITITPVLPYNSTTINNVTVTTGVVTNVGMVNI